MVHLHHYVVALLLLPLICYQGALIAVVHAFICGMHIEGSVRWGMDAWWEPKPVDPTPKQIVIEKIKNWIDRHGHQLKITGQSEQRSKNYGMF